MFSGNKKYLYILVIITILLPSGFVAIFELRSLQKNEEVVENAYNEQLDAILTSINQYSDDALTSMAREIGFSFREEESNLKNVLSNYSYIKTFFFLDSIPQHISISSIPPEIELDDKVHWISHQVENKLNTLKQFYEVGYYRLEPFNIENTDFVFFVFLIKKDNQLLPVAILVDALEFVAEGLDAQIQKIAGGQFEIAVLNNQDSLLYRSIRNNDEINIELTKPLSNFSEYKLGIALEGKTIGELIQERSKWNIYFVGTVSFILLLAAMLVIRILSKQIELTNLKSDFVSNVSHEIRTPLSLINMYAETMDMGRVPSKAMQQDYIRTILQETNRLSILVNKILNFSQIEKDKKTYILEKTNLNILIEETYNNYIPYLKKLGFTHELKLDLRIEDVMLDPESIKDVLINLIDNSIKYSFDKKSIVIKTGIFVNKAFFEVIDQGIGISEKDKKYVFDKFFRVSRNDVSIKVKGSGLGLSIVKHIVDGHNGKIEIKSKIKKGTTFRILFPKAT